jgi:RimJ/RimL family protein N-acetyltransferase
MPITIEILNNSATLISDCLKLVSLNQIEEELLVTHYLTLFGNSANVRMFLDGNPWDRGKVLNYVRLKRGIWLAGDPYSSFAIYDLKTNTFIGTLNLLYIKDNYAKIDYLNVIQVGIVIDESYVRQGIGQEVVDLGKAYIELTLTRKPEASASKEILMRPPPTGIILTVNPENAASLGLIRKKLTGSSSSGLFQGYSEKQPRWFFHMPLTSLAHTSEPVPEPIRAKL